MMSGRLQGVGRWLVGVALLVPLVGLLLSVGTPAEASGTVHIRMQNTQFIGPNGDGNVTVPAGTTVIWTNLDPFGHNVVSSDGAFVGMGQFDLIYGNDPNNRTFTFTFDEPGEYPYLCTPHPGMEGRVIVLPVPTATPLPRPPLRGHATPPAPQPPPALGLPPRPQPTPAGNPAPLPMPPRR